MGITRISALLVTFMLLPLTARAEWTVNMHPGVTTISRSVYHLHMTIFWICVAIACVVFGVMFWSIIRHRKSRGVEAHNFHENTLVEILWTVVPMVILVAMAVPATATLVKMYDPRNAAMDVKITGYQWKWHYEYPDQKLAFFSNLSTPRDQIDNAAAKDPNYLLEVDHPLVLPTKTKIRFLLTGHDVIHSWWVPALAVKKDAIPGFINEAWTQIDEPGIYRGQCAELCGVGHGFMPIVVDARPPEEFAKWVAQMKAEQSTQAQAATRTFTLDELMKQGEQVYLHTCAPCHQPTGMGIPGVFPALKGSPVTTGDVKLHIETVLHGRPGTAMQAFGNQLSATDLAAVITYERNAWGNNTGEAVSPSQIVQMLKQGAQGGAGK